jgi:hypothetical protein
MQHLQSKLRSPNSEPGPDAQYNNATQFDKIVTDIIETFSNSHRGEWYLQTVMDYLNKWPEIYAIYNKGALMIADVPVTNFFCHFWVPRGNTQQPRPELQAMNPPGCAIAPQSVQDEHHPSTSTAGWHYIRTVEQHQRNISMHHTDCNDRLSHFLFAYGASILENTGTMPASVGLGRSCALHAALWGSLRQRTYNRICGGLCGMTACHPSLWMATTEGSQPVTRRKLTINV